MGQLLLFVNNITRNFCLTSFLLGFILCAILTPISIYVGKQKHIGKEIQPLVKEIAEKKIPEKKKELALYNLYKTRHYNVFRIYIISIAIAVIFGIFAFLFLCPLKFISSGKINADLFGINILKQNFIIWVPLVTELLFLMQTTIQDRLNNIPFKIKDSVVLNGVGIISLYCVMTCASTSYFVFQMGFSFFRILFYGILLCRKMACKNFKKDVEIQNLH